MDSVKQNPPIRRGVLRADEFYDFESLMEHLPEGVSRDAIRKLVSEKSLPVHRIGHYRFFYGREIIEASRVGGDEME